MAQWNFADSASVSGESEAEVPIADNRHGARQLALQALYWASSGAGALEMALGELSRRFGLSKAVGDFAASLAHAAALHAGELEALVDEVAGHWKQDRIARIDGIILRLALAEMLYFDEIPVRVSIDEAVRLAKTYSGARAHAFVNGVLDAAVRRRKLSAPGRCAGRGPSCGER